MGRFLKLWLKNKKKGKASYLSCYGTIAPGDRRLRSHSKDPEGRAGSSSELASKCCFYALAGDVVGKEPPTRPWMGTLGHCRNEKAARQSLFNPTKSTYCTWTHVHVYRQKRKYSHANIQIPHRDIQHIASCMLTQTHTTDTCVQTHMQSIQSHTYIHTYHKDTHIFIQNT